MQSTYVNRDFKRFPPIIEICMENAICNMKCKYCFGGYVDGHNGHTGKVTEFKPEVLDKVLRRVDPNYQGGIKIWGGEPLANWETFKQVADYAKRKFPMAKLLLITNGSLLTKEKAKFLAKYNFSVNISHDGIGQTLRGKDYLVEGSEQVEAIKYLKLNNAFGSFHSVITNASDDLDKQIDYWYNVSENIVEFPFDYSWSIFRKTDDWTKTFMPNMDKHNEWIDYTFENMIDCVQGNKRRVNFMFSTDQDRAMQWLIFGRFAEYPCSTFDSITVGLTGKEYRCVQDCERRSVTESETYADLMKRENWKLLPECDTCKVRPMCAGMCAVLTDEQRKENCENYINFYSYMTDYFHANRQRADLIARYYGAIPMDQQQPCENECIDESEVTLEEHNVNEDKTCQKQLNP